MSEPKKFTIEERVRWGDVDAARIIFYGSYIRFFEIAETELFRAVGMAYGKVFDDLDIWLPRVHLECDFHRAAQLDDLLEVSVYVGKVGRTSMRLDFEVRRKGDDGKIEAEPDCHGAFCARRGRSRRLETGSGPGRVAPRARTIHRNDDLAFKTPDRINKIHMIFPAILSIMWILSVLFRQPLDQMIHSQPQAPTVVIERERKREPNDEENR
jgi:YbgC/YbaW family acyl-CoA thioester hydrolase